MGRCQAILPMFGTQSLWAPRAPVDQGRQQPLWPLQRFAMARVFARVLSGWASLVGNRPGLVRCLGQHGSTFLHPFAPPALLGFFATMGALTPGRPALRFPKAHEHRLGRRPGLPAFCHRIFRSFRLQPPTVVPIVALGFSRRAYRTTLPWSPFSRVQASVGLRHQPAGSPRRSAESSSLALRTNRSPPVALHPASRRRSYRQLRSARTLRQGLSPC
jgi:hypothetical protein